MDYSDLVAISEGAMTLDEIARQHKAVKAAQKPLNAKEYKKMSLTASTAMLKHDYATAKELLPKLIATLRMVRADVVKVPEGDWADAIMSSGSQAAAAVLGVIKLGYSPKDGAKWDALYIIDQQLDEYIKSLATCERKLSKKKG